MPHMGKPPAVNVVKVLAMATESILTAITEPTVIMPGLTARPTSTGFISVDLGYEADPIAFTPEVIAAEKARLPGWRWRKEYERDATAQAGMPAFDVKALDRQKRHLREPLYRMDLAPTFSRDTLEENPNGRVYIYVEPDDQGEHTVSDPVERVIRSCGMGIDVGEGVEQSDSTIEVFFADNREQAAEVADNQTNPTELGRLAVALAKFYNDALVCCVRPMHGITTIRTMVDELGYHNVWHERIADRRFEKNTSRLGWRKGEASSALLFGRWQDALTQDDCTLHSLATWQDHQQYQFDERGRICHAKVAALPQEVRERHGDRVVGCALAYRACIDLPHVKDVVKRRPTVIEQEIERRQAARKNVWRR